MIDQLSDVTRGRLAVDPQALCFGNACFACAAAGDVGLLDVRFTRTLLFGVLGGIESTWLTVPLCADCASSYLRVMRRITAIQVACALLGAAFIGMLLLSFENDMLKPYETLLVTLGVSPVVVAYLSIGQRAKALPVRFEPLQYGRRGGYGAYVFTFEHESAAALFAESNQ